MLNVMIVDDSKIVRDLMSKIVINLGHIVSVQSHDGWDALEKYKNLRPDIVFLDITMPKLNGIEALKKIRQHHKDAKIVMMTSRGEEYIVKECIKLGAVGYILKPLSVTKVEETIQKVFGNDQFAS